MIEKVVLRLLSLKSYSTCELRKKLVRRGFDPPEIEIVLEKFQKLGFLNDQDLAERRGEAYKRRGYGPHRIAGKFKQQGLNPSSYSPEEQKEIILRLLKSPIYARKDRHKKIAALQRRGFDLEIIFEVV
ncbi:MAG TPA: RecX family transcriptional regulator [Rhabdochlamydiaceae bacterium]|jgi:regulatory protein|nr:RecX family transcriptional regulator [Rhabdochlamydiaceae bacterium]